MPHVVLVIVKAGALSSTASIVTQVPPGLVIVMLWSGAGLFTGLEPKLRLEGLAVTATPAAELVASELLHGEGLGLGVSVDVAPPVSVDVTVGLTEAVGLAPPAEGPGVVTVALCLPACPSSRGISTARPVMVAAMPDTIPGTVVQNDLFSAMVGVL
jgi:hypothetical protein